jgi:uncharacterized membrane protein SpoIIM required for sporulation
MNLDVFLNERQPHWRQFEELLYRVEGSSLKSLTDDQAILFGSLYRRTASDLNQAQSFVSSDEIVAYLNQLVARGYQIIYGAPPNVPFYVVAARWLVGYAAVVRECMPFIALATLVFVLGSVVGFGFALADPTFKECIIPEGFTHITPHAEGPHLSGDDTASFSGQLFWNNSNVALRCFAFGLTFGIGTVAALFFNGLLIGVVAAEYWQAGEAVRFSAEVLPHGVLEIPAFLLAGGAGLMLGKAMIVARPWSRFEELIDQGKRAVQLTAGTIALLSVAAILEAGVARLPSHVLTNWAKLLVALIVGTVFLLYIMAVGRTRSFEGSSGS